jgi:hypothetical protein
LKNHLTLIGILIIGGGLFAFSQILQKAQSLLTPEMLAKIAAQKPASWTGFLLPLAPLVLAYLLLPHFPNHQAWVAVPGMLLGAILVFRELRASARRSRALELPEAYYQDVRKANLTLVISMLVGGALLAYAHWRLFLVPVPG